MLAEKGVDGLNGARWIVGARRDLSHGPVVPIELVDDLVSRGLMHIVLGELHPIHLVVAVWQLVQPASPAPVHDEHPGIRCVDALCVWGQLL